MKRQHGWVFNPLTKRFYGQGSEGIIIRGEIKYHDYIIKGGEFLAPGMVFQFVHEQYDGPEDHRHGEGKTIDDCMDQIDEKILEQQEEDEVRCHLCHRAKCRCDQIYEEELDRRLFGD